MKGVVNVNLVNLSNYLLPILVLSIIIYGFYHHVPLYDAFTKGAKEGMELAFSIFPFFMAMIFGVNILLKSGFLDQFFLLFQPLFSFFKIPIEILPMAIIRPISGNASFAIMIDLIKKYGVDSFLGRLAATLQGSTDTTIYVLTLYFGSIGIKNSKYALAAGLLADTMALIVSILLVRFIFF